MRQEKWTIKTPQGEVLTSFVVEAEPLEPSVATPSGGSAAGSEAPRRPASGGPDGESRMTDPQRRYLFRLLAAQNVTGKQAEEHLGQHFKVGKLSDITKSAASEYINQLAADRKEAAGGSH